MKRRITFEQLTSLVEGDGEFVNVLIENGMIESVDRGFCAEDVDRVLACRTLVRELEVNWAGVEIILRLRQELAVARARLLELEATADRDAD